MSNNKTCRYCYDDDPNTPLFVIELCYEDPVRALCEYYQNNKLAFWLMDCTTEKIFLRELYPDMMEDPDLHNHILKYLIQDVECTYIYAKYVIEDRFPEGEETMSRDSIIWDSYQNFLSILS